MKYIKEHPNVLKENIISFEEEIAYLGGSQVLIAMGNKSYGLLIDNLKDKYRIEKMSHYARAMSKKDYREELLLLS